MSSKDRRKREVKALRTAILEAARRICIEDGLKGVTMRKIAAAIDYSPTTIYLYFKNKDDVLRSVCAEDMKTLMGYFRAREGRGGDTRERLTALARAYIRFAMDHPEQYRFMFMTPGVAFGPGEVEVTHGDPAQDAYAYFRATVAEVVGERPEEAEVERVAQALWSAVHGLVSLRICLGEGRWVAWRPLTEVEETMLVIMVEGLRRYLEGRRG